MAPQFQQINPITHIDDGDKDKSHRNEHEDCPLVGDAESAMGEPHEEVPQTTEHQDSQPWDGKELSEEGTEIGEQTSGNDHLLTEEVRSGEEEVQLLGFPKEIVFEIQQRCCYQYEGEEPSGKGFNAMHGSYWGLWELWAGAMEGHQAFEGGFDDAPYGQV